MKNGFKRIMAGVLTALILSSFIPISFAQGEDEDLTQTVVPENDGDGDILTIMEDEPEASIESIENAESTDGIDNEENTDGSQSITITFRIDNPDYTSDPESGHTHLTVNSPITLENTTLSADERWGSSYKVAGTGDLAVYTIPSGTSISDNGYSLPQLDVTNASWLSNRYDYLSTRNWVTSSGRICTDDTVFSRDTVLSVSLYEADEIYSVDFICCEEHNASAGFYCNHGTPNFKLGESYSRDLFITKNDLLEGFPTTNHTFDNFTGWQLKVTSTGEYVPFTPGLPITAEYVDAQYGNSIKAYPVWEETVVPVTASFMNGEALVESRSLNAGDALGALPQATASEGGVFLGWQYIGADNTTIYANENTIITADTLYTAVFSAGGNRTVTFHDILSDGTEAELSVNILLPVGSSLADIDDASLYDDTLISECVWYTEGRGEIVDLSEFILMEDTELYTYSHELVLIYNQNAALMAMAKSVEVTPGENGAMTIRITAREGEALSLSDFIINGVDYSLYEWTYTDDQNQTQILDIDELIVNGINDSVEAVSSGAPANPDITPVSDYPIHFYIFIDGVRHLKESRSITAYRIWDPTAWSSTGGGAYRYYALAQTLEEVYGDFGFEASELVPGTRYFPNTTRNDSTIWADSAIVVHEGRAFSPLGVGIANMDVYYLPKQTLTANKGSWANFQSTESFYSIEVRDESQFVYTEHTLPGKSYTLKGDTAEITVSNTALVHGQEITWECTGKNSGALFTGTENQDGTTTFTIPNIAEPLIISPVLQGEDPPLTIEEGHRVNFYIFIDDQRVNLESRYPVTAYLGETTRRYLPADIFESVYGDFGFEASDLLPGTRYFPHTDVNGAKIWADTPVMMVGNVAYSPIITHKNNAVDIYYLPHQTQPATGGVVWENFKQSDSFYSVRVEDMGELFYTAEDIPGVSYTLRGNTATITLTNTPLAEGDDVIWNCIGQKTGLPVEGTDNIDGTITFVIENISEPYVISSEFDHDIKRISYDINRPHPPIDLEYECPTIEGADTYSELTEEHATTYTVRSPSQTAYLYATYKNNVLQKHVGKAVFLGWAVNGNTHPDALLEPGDVLDLTQYTGSISLKAQWYAECANQDNSTGSMVNYYVSLAALPLGDNTLWTGSIEQTAFTASVYADDCGIDAGIVPDLQLYDEYITTGGARQWIVLGGTGGTDINVSHAMITNNLLTGYTMTSPVDGQDHTFRVSFPSDEMVLRRIRQLMQNGTSIVINGQPISIEEMNSVNFSVRWYVFKYDRTDGWHIDGVLVAKPGTMRIVKTFTGDDIAAIEAVKENYSINVTPLENQSGIVHTGGTLFLEDAEHTEGTNTYTWNVPVDLYYRYNVTENNYLYDDNLTASIAQYEVRNARASGDNTSDLMPYESAITLTGQGSYSDDPPLTVVFLNTYTKPGTLTLQKVDSTTGHGMRGLNFYLKDEQNNPVQLYSTGGSNYTMNPDEGEACSYITTGANGQAFITMTEGTYNLFEVVPEGYEEPGEITFTMDDVDGHILITQANAENEGVISWEANTLMLSLRNHSETTNLTVRKIWAEGTTTKSVSIRLYRNGEAVGSLVTLNGTEAQAWTHVFTDVPLYVDGEPAVYTIREERIGDFYYSPEFVDDGYLYYTVSYTSLRYLDSQGHATNDITQAASAILSVTNSRNKASLSIRKVNDYGLPLPGAVFKLYSTESVSNGAAEFTEENLVNIGISEGSGIVDFGVINEGQYYMVEYAAPEGYERSNTVYQIAVWGSIVVMERWDPDANRWIDVPDYTIMNNRIRTDVVISKQVSGMLGEKSKLFEFSVTCTERIESGIGYTLSADGHTADFHLQHGQSITLNGVPLGAQLTITELNADKYEKNIEIDGVSVQDNSVIVLDDMELTVNNWRDIQPDIGVLLDSLPYVLILGGVLAVIVILIIRKRKNRDDD